MIIKKMTLAAAVSIGIFAVSNCGFCADLEVEQKAIDDVEIVAVKDNVQIQEENILDVSCGCNKQHLVPESIRTRMDSTKGCDTCNTPRTTGAAAPCDPCEELIIEDECNPCEVDPCDPCEVDPCDPCEIQETGPAAPCPLKGCDTNQCGPMCSSCNGAMQNAPLAEFQKYAYPRNIFGIPTIISTATNPIANIDATKALQVPSAMLNDGGAVVTGAAVPVVDDSMVLGMNRGSIVDSSPQGREGYGCPITIQTSSSMEVVKKTMVPIDLVKTTQTGAAAPLINTFDDVPADFWAAKDINRLAASKVIAGYPNQTFRPHSPVTRAEFASLVVSGLNYQGEKYYSKSLFSDVPNNYWAKIHIGKGVNGGLLSGYPDGKFRPNNHVTRAEAMVIIAKALPDCDMDDCKANDILSKYEDASLIPDWAKLSVAKVLKADILKNSPDPDRLNPNALATRADMAGMLANVRVALGIDPAELACGCTETGAAAFVEQMQTVKIPTVKVKFSDTISARESNVGDNFVAYTTEAMTVNGVHFPCGSKVKGQIVEVQRPSGKCEGGLRIIFTQIEDTKCDKKAELPRDILAAQVKDSKKPNVVSRLLKWPFIWTGALIGNVGRTVGGAAIGLSNASEHVLDALGTGTGELFQGKFRAAGGSLGESLFALGKAPFDLVGTAVSGTAGIFEVTADEFAYVIDAKGTKLARINSNDIVQVAFGCMEK